MKFPNFQNLFQVGLQSSLDQEIFVEFSIDFKFPSLEERLSTAQIILNQILEIFTALKSIYENDTENDVELDFSYEQKKQVDEFKYKLTQLFYYFGLYYWTLPYPRREEQFGKDLRRLGCKDERRNLFQIGEVNFVKMLNKSLNVVFFNTEPRSSYEAPYRNFFFSALYFYNEHFLLELFKTEDLNLLRKFGGKLISPNKKLSPEKQIIARQFFNEKIPKNVSSSMVPRIN